MTKISNDMKATQKTTQDKTEETPQTCLRCLAIRYFLISVLGIAILALFARDKLHFLEGATPMNAAILLMALGGVMALARILFHWLEKRHQLKLENEH